MLKAGIFIPELLGNLGHAPATREYPFVKTPVPPGFRGTPRLRPGLCVGCKACMRDCTAEAIEIVQVPPDPNAPPPEPGTKNVGKKFKMILYLDRCVHCARCADVCPKDAIYLDEEYEMANFTRDALRLEME
ncbi:MAG: 4Fe-4S dicluster domain-containing protein [Acidobacteria bacterium]|nr:4Fe-4S dicluster domain-containing protein [Acidobacteriota bacterium]